MRGIARGFHHLQTIPLIPMEIFLLEDISGIGTKYSIQVVPDSYALNELLPQRKALVATPTVRKRYAEQIRNGNQADTPDLSLLTDDVAASLMLQCVDDSDTESAHANADALLCMILKQQGFTNTVKTYHKVDKWYA